MAPLDQMTEVLQTEIARFPRARLIVAKGPDKGAAVTLEGQSVVVGTDETCQLQLRDSSVSRRHLELSGGPGGYRLRDLRSTNGVFVEGVQVMDGKLTHKVRITVGRSELRFEPERTEIQWPLSARDRFGEVFGRSLPMRRLFAVLERAAPAESPVVLEGEPGTGKETLAHAIHEKSLRREGPFVVVDVGAASESGLEADLFGHDSNTRPGGRPGAFEEASSGTLYLDEVAELSNTLQARVLRVLETKEVKRPRRGGTAKADVRVVASTQKDLEAEVKAGRFREDLFFKLSVFRVRVPPLRERPEDIPALVRHFESRFPTRQPLGQDTLEMLARHDWPGNIRELRNVLERLAAFPDLGAAAIARALSQRGEGEATTSGARLGTEKLLELPWHEAKQRLLESFEKTYLLEHLKAANGVVTRTAQRTGLPRQSVHRLLKRLGLSASDEG